MSVEKIWVHEWNSFGGFMTSRQITVSYPEPESDPFKSEEYTKFVESMIPLCHCRESNRPCDGVLAGGICDGMKDDPIESDDDELAALPCACVHSDARTCARRRDGYEPDDRHYHPRDCECDCHKQEDDWDFNDHETFQP